MSKIYILAGHTPDPLGGKYDPGATAHGVKEADLVNEFVDLVCGHFREWAVRHATDNDADSLAQVVSKLELTADDILCDVHTNASANPLAAGVEVFVPYRATQKEIQLAKAILDAIVGLTGLKSRGVKDETQTARKRLAVMRENGTNVLIELFFLTNLSDLSKYNAKKKDIALSVANILKKFSGQ